MKNAAIIAGISLAIAGPAAAAPIAASYWDAGSSFASIDDAIAYTQANVATATFDSEAINYANFSGLSFAQLMTLEDFVGTAEAPSILGNATGTLENSVFHFSGILNLNAGDYVVGVGSGDGHRLSLGGNVISESNTSEDAQTNTVDVTLAGPIQFDLYYFENAGPAGVVLRIDGAVVTESIVDAQVPLPGTLPLMLLGLGALGLRARRTS